ncbi:zinc finger protein basonuclin-2-like, partial [Scleropages formosus]
GDVDEALLFPALVLIVINAPASSIRIITPDGNWHLLTQMSRSLGTDGIHDVQLAVEPVPLAVFAIGTIKNTPDAAGKVLDRWTIMSREEEIITLQQFLRFGETKSIVELMAIQEKEGQAVTVPSSKTDSDIRTFIESNNRSRSPTLLTHLENSNPSSIHHFENIPNSLAFLLPFQYINPVSAPMLGLPPNGLMLEQPSLRLREPSLPNPSEPNESNESEVSLSPFRSGQSPSRGMHRMRRMGSTSRKGRVCCNACGKTFYDKGTLKIHYNAVHLKIKHRCTIEGCNMVFSSLRSRNRHSANPNPRLHMPMLRNNRDKDLIRVNSSSGTPVISSTKGGLTLTSPGRPPLGFATPPLDPMLQSPLQSPLVFPSLKSVQPVQPVPPFYRNLLSPGELVSPSVSLPTSPILPTATNSTSLIEQQQQQQVTASNSQNPILSEPGLVGQRLLNLSGQDHSIDPMPKKKPRKSSMPVKIEKEVISVPDAFEDRDEEEEDSRPLNGLPSSQGFYSHSHLHNNGSQNSSNHSGGSCQQSPSQDEMSPGLALRTMLQHEREEARAGGELRCMDSFSSEDQDHERDFENESETSESKMCCGDELMDTEDQRNFGSLDKELEVEENHMKKEMADNGLSSPSPHQPVIKIKEELSDPTYDMFCMGQYGLYNGGGGMAAAAAAAAAAASMAALHESFVSSMGYSASPPKFSSQSSEGDLYSSPDPKICYVCKKSFKSSYSVKLHYKNVHLKEMHMCTVAGCNAAFPSRRSRDRALRNELLAKIYGSPHLALDALAGAGGAVVLMKELGHDIGDGDDDDDDDPAGADYSRADSCARFLPSKYAALDLSAASSVHSGGSTYSWRGSDEGSDEGILLDDLEGASDGEEGCDRAAEGGDGSGGRGCGDDDPASRATPGGIVCALCHKVYSNKGTLRVHFKTVHLREMHKCKVPGCSMIFSSVRSRNRHSQNPNLHKQVPFGAVLH